MLRILSLILVLTIASLGQLAYALDLQAAKASGVVGEKQDGYIAVVTPPASAEVNALVTDVNQKRLDAYKAISTENKQTLNVVETLAAKKLIDKLEPGTYYQTPAGNWAKK